MSNHNSFEPIFTQPISEWIWDAKYRLAESSGTREASILQSWARVALALSKPEQHHRTEWNERFRAALSHFRFLPGGRILAGAGTNHRTTLFNCFVLRNIDDSIEAIFSALGEAMITMQEGGGVGCDFSSLRPAGMAAEDSGNIASGPVSFMHVWDRACATLISTGRRRGAMMATLRCDHPDIEAFINAKRDNEALRHFNLSVLISDAFMQAVEQDSPWQLIFPLAGRPVPAGAMVCERFWSGSNAAEPCLVARTVMARALWDGILEAAFQTGDPGVIFIDRVQRANNLWYAEHISAVNPCGEVPLPPHGACNLGSINLTQFIDDPFGRHPRLDLQGIAGTAAVAARMLDNVYDVSHFPLPAQEKVARASRRIGLGITGLADAFAMLGVRYGSDASIEIAHAVMRTVCHAAYRTSIELARERGIFPEFRATEYLAGDFLLTLPRDMLNAIQKDGIHNSHLTAIAPAGSISLLANNVSSGIEPIFALRATRKVIAADGRVNSMPATDFAWALFCRINGETASVPDYFVEAYDIDPIDQLKLQAALQTHVDQAISKTINLPAAASLERCRELYLRAYELGLKGCTIFRRDAAASPVLTSQEESRHVSESAVVS